MAKLKPFTRISLRFFLVLVALACFWAAKVSIDARRQKSAVEWVEKHGGLVKYDWEIDLKNPKSQPTNPTPAWLRSILGDDCFQTVHVVDFSKNSDNRDFSSLAELPDVKFLGIYGAPLSNLSFIANLPHLELLMLRDCEIVDLGPLAQLTELKTLALDNNRIVDLTPLESVRSLSTLTCAKNQVRDLSPISKLSNLVALELSDNPISDVSPVTALTRIEVVKFDGCEITDCSPLMRVPSLVVARVERNPGVTEEDDLKLQQYTGRPRD